MKRHLRFLLALKDISSSALNKSGPIEATSVAPTAVRQTGYQYLWVIGAVCPESGHAEGLLSPQLNTKMINIFMKQFAATIPAGEHAVMVWDGAGFHTAKPSAPPPTPKAQIQIEIHIKFTRIFIEKHSLMAWYT